MKAYCDTSVLLKRLFLEPDTTQVCDTLDRIGFSGGSLVTSVLTRVEMARAILRVSPEVTDAEVGSLADSALADLVQVGLTSVYLESAMKLRVPHLGSLDSLHVATALVVGCDVMLTRDRQMARACEELGLAVA